MGGFKWGLGLVSFTDWGYFFFKGDIGGCGLVPTVAGRCCCSSGGCDVVVVDVDEREEIIYYFNV